MGKIYRINSTKETNIKGYIAFDVNGQEENVQNPSTYMSILTIFREAFKLIDLSTIIKKQ